MTRTTPGRTKHDKRPRRESLSKRLGKVADQIKARDHYRCVYCQGTQRPMHLDHLTPKSAGGQDVATNLVLACASCNSARQDMTLSRWAAYARDVFGFRFSPKDIRAQARRRLPV